MAKRVLTIPNYPSNNHTTNRQSDADSVPIDQPNYQPSVKKSSAVIDLFSGVFDNIILPMLKSAINDALVSLIASALKIDQSTSRNSYNSMYRQRQTNFQQSSVSYRQPRRGVGDVEEFVFSTQHEAAHVLGRLFDILAEYRWVSVGDYYSIVGEQSSSVHQRYGWSNLDRARIIPTSDGFVLSLPQPSYS